MPKPQIDTGVEMKIIGDLDEKYKEPISEEIKRLDRLWYNGLKAFLEELSEDGKHFKFELKMHSNIKDRNIDDVINEIHNVLQENEVDV